MHQVKQTDRWQQPLSHFWGHFSLYIYRKCARWDLRLLFGYWWKDEQSNRLHSKQLDLQLIGFSNQRAITHIHLSCL